MGLYNAVVNKFDGRKYHVSSMRNPIVGFWETAVFADPGPALGGEPERGDTILPVEMVGAGPITDLREREIEALARLGPSAAHAAIVSRVMNEPPITWKMSHADLEASKEFTLRFIDSRRGKLGSATTADLPPAAEDGGDQTSDADTEVYGYPDDFPVEASEHYSYWAAATQYAHGANLRAAKASYGYGFREGYKQGGLNKGVGTWLVAAQSGMGKAVEDSEKYRKRLDRRPDPETLAQFWWAVGYADGFLFGYHGHTSGIRADSRDPETMGLSRPKSDMVGKALTGIGLIGVVTGYGFAALLGLLSVLWLVTGQFVAALVGGLATAGLVWWVRH